MTKIELKQYFFVKNVDFRGGRPLYERSGLITAAAAAAAAAMAMAVAVAMANSDQFSIGFVF